MKKVAIKYCGGCNPRFDRVALTAKLFEAFPQLVPVKSDATDAWMVLVICGCSRGCASSHVQSEVGDALICDATDYDKLYERLAHLLIK